MRAIPDAGRGDPNLLDAYNDGLAFHWLDEQDEEGESSNGRRDLEPVLFGDADRP